MSCLELDDEAVLKVAEPMMDDIMAGVSRRDYKRHSSHFSVVLKSVVGPDEFLEACDKQESDWGLPGARELVAIFRKEKSFTLIWDQHYDRTEGQVVAMTTIAVKGGRYFVDHFALE
ncbi:MAG: hypothetical protein AB8B87_13000 [Granulosicoccus sp.]